MRVQTAQLMMMLPQILQLYRNLMGFVMAANNARVAGRGRAAAAGRGRGGRAAGRGCHGGRAAVAGSDLDSEEDGIALDDSRPPPPPPPAGRGRKRRKVAANADCNVVRKITDNTWDRHNDDRDHGDGSFAV